MSLMMVASGDDGADPVHRLRQAIVEVLEEQPEITDSAADPALTVENGDVDFDCVYFNTTRTAMPNPGGACSACISTAA